MRTKTELKAAAFDKYINAAELADISQPSWAAMQTASATLNAIYKAEKAYDEREKLVDGGIYMFTHSKKGVATFENLGVYSYELGAIICNGKHCKREHCFDIVTLRKSPN